MSTNAEDAARAAMPEVALLRAELAARKRTCSCSYWAHTDEVMPSPNCPTHGVEATDRWTMAHRVVAALRDLCALHDAWEEARGALRDFDDTLERLVQLQESCDHGR